MSVHMPGLSSQSSSDRPRLEQMAGARWNLESHNFRHLTYNGLLLFYSYGPNWQILAPKAEVEMAVAHFR